MSDAIAETEALVRLQEQLRQERETFNQRKEQDHRWFRLRLAMGWSAVVLLPSIGVTASWVVFNHDNFGSATIATATATLFVDVLGVVVSVWRVVMGAGPLALTPVTVPDRANRDSQSQ